MSGSALWVPLQGNAPTAFDELQKYNEAMHSQAATATEREMPAFRRAETTKVQIENELNKLMLQGRIGSATALQQAMQGGNQTQDDSSYATPASSGGSGGGGQRPFTPSGHTGLERLQTDDGGTEPQPNTQEAGTTPPTGDSAPNVLERLRQQQAQTTPYTGTGADVDPNTPPVPPPGPGESVQAAAPNPLQRYQIAGEMQPPPTRPPANTPTPVSQAPLPPVQTAQAQPQPQATTTAPAPTPQARAAYLNGTSPNGLTLPGVGPISKVDAAEVYRSVTAGQDPGKAMQEAVARRNQRLFQLASGATDDATWNNNVGQAWREGIITNGQRDQFMGHFSMQQGVIRSLTSADVVTSQNTSAAGMGGRFDENGKFVPDRASLSVKEPITGQTAVLDKDGKPTGAYQNVVIPRDKWVLKDYGSDAGPMVTVRQTFDGKDGNKYYTEKQVPASLVTPASAPGAGSAGVSAGPAFDRYKQLTRQAEGTANGSRPNQMGSGADGNYQWMPQTWLETVKQYAPDAAAGKTDAQILAMRGNNPQLEDQMFSKFTAQNEARLRQLNIPVNASTDRLAHWFGADGVKKMFSVDENTPIENIAEPAVVQQNRLAGKTVGDVAKMVRDQFGLKPVNVGGGGGATPAAAPGTTPASTGGTADVPPGSLVGAPQLDPVKQKELELAQKGREATIASVTQRVDEDSKEVADNQTGAMASQRSIPTILDLRQRVAAMPDAAFGAGADGWRMTLNSAMAAFSPKGANDLAAWITQHKIDPNNVSQMQDLRKEFFSMVTAAESANPGTRVGAMLTNYFSKTMPNLSMTKPAIQEMLNVVLVGAQMARDYAAQSQDHFNRNNQAWIDSDGVPKSYRPLSEFNQKWTAAGSANSPQVYEAAARLMNHGTKEIFDGLNDDQKRMAFQIANRVEPGISFSDDQMPAFSSAKK